MQRVAFVLKISDSRVLFKFGDLTYLFVDTNTKSKIGASKPKQNRRFLFDLEILNWQSMAKHMMSLVERPWWSSGNTLGSGVGFKM